MKRSIVTVFCLFFFSFWIVPSVQAGYFSNGGLTWTSSVSGSLSSDVKTLNGNIHATLNTYSPGVKDLNVSSTITLKDANNNTIATTSTSGYVSWPTFQMSGTLVVDAPFSFNMSSLSDGNYYLIANTSESSQYDGSQSFTDTSSTISLSRTSATLSAAQAAQSAAQAAQDGTNTIINNYLSTSAGIVQDSSGNTVLSVAKAAKASADTASQNALFL